MKAAIGIVVCLIASLVLVVPVSVRSAAPSQEGGATQKIEKTAKKGAKKTKEGAEKVVDKTKEGLSKTGEVITDGWITTHVKTRFIGEDLLKGSDINVDTDKHVVTLKGTVASAAGRARAADLAKTTEGVHRVVNRLTIAPKKG